MNRKIPLLLLSAAYTACLLYFSSIPSIPVIGQAVGFSNGWYSHFTAYAVYAALLLVTMKVSRKSVIAAVVMASIVGAIAETMQLYFPGRSYDVIDWSFDVLGAIVGVTVLILLNRNRKKKVRQTTFHHFSNGSKEAKNENKP